MEYPKQWEYLQVDWCDLSKAPHYGSLEYWGLQGWELAAIGGNPAYGHHYIFKRPLKKSITANRDGGFSYEETEKHPF